MSVTILGARIKAIQKKLAVPQSGVYDLPLIIKLETLMGITSTAKSFQLRKEAIQRKLGFTGNDVDGIFGVNTTTRIEQFVGRLLPAIPPSASMLVSTKALDLIVQSEISSEATYNTKYKHPVWPGSSSGITIGIGFDLGYFSESKIENLWSPFLSAAKINILKSVAGLTGAAAQKALRDNKGGIKLISIDFKYAQEVFYTASLPAYAKAVKSIYPAIAKLPPDAQGALLSLVYNRGNSLDGDRRREMRNIVPMVAAVNLKGIASQVRSMKRLWDTAATKGLVIRREKEALLIENARNFYNIDEVVVV